MLFGPQAGQVLHHWTWPNLGRRDGQCMHRGLRPAAGRVHSHANRSGSCSRSRYEELYENPLPPEGPVDAKHEQMKAQVKWLLSKQKQLGGGGGGGAPRLPARPAAAALLEGRAPSRLVNPVSTLPGQKSSQAWAPGHGTGRRAGDEIDVPGSRRQPPPPLQLPQQDEGRPGGRLFRPQEAPRTSISSETPRHPAAGWAGSGSAMHSGAPGSQSQVSRGANIGNLGAEGNLLMRQIELKAAMRPPSAEPPRKSPWRPPGGLSSQDGLLLKVDTAPLHPLTDPSPPPSPGAVACWICRPRCVLPCQLCTHAQYCSWARPSTPALPLSACLQARMTRWWPPRSGGSPGPACTRSTGPATPR